MKAFLKKYGSVLYILAASAAVVIVVFSNTDVGMIASSLRLLRPGPTFGAAACMIVYFLLRTATTGYYLKTHGYRLSLRDLLGVTGTGEFYSAITPSASGGQPAQILYLRRCSVPAGVGTACMSIKFIGFQLAFILLGAVLWSTRWDAVTAQLYGFRWLVALGFALNLALVALVLLTVPRITLVERLAEKTVRLLARLRLVADPQAALSKFLGSVEDYRGALRQLLTRPKQALVLFLLSLAEAVAYFLMPVLLYHAFGLAGTSDIMLFTLHVLLFLASAFLPLPGAAGASETGFCIFLAGIYPEGDIATAMLCWRFFSYYLLLILGFGTMLLGRAKGRRGEGR